MYDFTQLSPADFEELTRDLLQQHWGVSLESFKSGRDKGIDLRYAAGLGEKTIIQCKHFAGSSVATLAHQLRTKEFPKIELLAPQRYVLVTSLPLNPDDKETLMAAVAPFITKPGDIFGHNDINNLLKLHPEIETQHFKLWMSSTAVLQRVLNNAEETQTDFEIERVRRTIPLYVQTADYHRAMKILADHNFVIISGVPGIGKTTLANMLLFSHLEAGYSPVVMQCAIAEGKKQFRRDSRQIFYFDDFLGETFLGNRLFDFLGKKEDSEILNFIELISRSNHSKLVLTTREHILGHAFQVSDRFRRARPDLAAQRCILEMNSYTLLDRARILYNHIFFSDLPRMYKNQLLKNDFYLSVLKHRNFNPRLVEWLSRFPKIKKIPAARYQNEVHWVLENPEQLWRIAFEQQISESSRSLVLTLYSLGGKSRLDRLKPAWNVLHEHRANKYRWTTAAEDWRRSLQDLEGGFLELNHQMASFVNPSVNDFLNTLLASEPEHLDDLLGSAISFEQVVNIWALAQSEKGEGLRLRLKSSPHKLMTAVTANLERPHEERVEFQGGYATIELDVRPEIRMRTMLAIADYTQSPDALDAALRFIHNLEEFWKNHRPDFGVATAGLSILEQLTLSHPKVLEGHAQLKAALLRELSPCYSCSDIVSLVDYSSKSTLWTENNQQNLIELAGYYLEDSFYSELADITEEDELVSLSWHLDNLSDHLGLKVASQQDAIDTRTQEIPHQEDEDDRPVRRWNSEGNSSSVQTEEAEIRRLFDGLR